MRRQVELFLCALQFLTRIPVPALGRFDPDWITRSAPYFPLVGQMVGGISALVLWGASRLWSAPVAALLAVAAGALVTGGFHEDGLADTADGLGGGQTPERRLEIMKDSRIGTYGLLALGLVLALKVAVLASVPPIRGAILLLAAHGLGRAASVAIMRLTPYAALGEAGKWKPTPQGVTWAEASIAVVLSLWPLASLPAGPAVLGVICGALGVGCVATLARRLIGGHTGDVLGGCEQIFELGFLLGAAALLAP
ncbi:MAG: adenosylcobinamide-GDP ribazoletransferase [Caulobacteraceae bacterium]|nr:adenosylcobinamide-GDP ribazoletransferase [Caulobacteraceae bacterium]